MYNEFKNKCACIHTPTDFHKFRQPEVFQNTLAAIIKLLIDSKIYSTYNVPFRR
jgi:hypothetical protein